MKELEQVLSIAAADYKVHIQAIAQLNAAIESLNKQNNDLQKENNSLKTQNAALLKNINTPIPAQPDTPIEGTPDAATAPNGEENAK
ncbi:hypothetical protein PQ472_07685 [Lacticaseibacillus pabuli]|uniref:Uncharacterized protein n=1 Tax=Lacticaseibacillus pabuli TaxID=3025672 RepID=A0ABY7WV48_9LACO|nr:hypothetical protein [Lacticaseibacillus sp. KACC 23028]WDF81805.1 hypothetical protein PQ472_07685 [Lacticaseibacillus sp. KACC 23028]